MSRKVSKNKVLGSANRCPPKAKVARSNRAECANPPPPKTSQLLEISAGVPVYQRIAFDGFVPKQTLFILRSDAKRLEKYLKAQRSEKPRARSA